MKQYFIYCKDELIIERNVNNYVKLEKLEVESPRNIEMYYALDQSISLDDWYPIIRIQCDEDELKSLCSVREIFTALRNYLIKVFDNMTIYYQSDDNTSIIIRIIQLIHLVHRIINDFVSIHEYGTLQYDYSNEPVAYPVKHINKFIDGGVEYHYSDPYKFPKDISTPIYDGRYISRVNSLRAFIGICVDDNSPTAIILYKDEVNIDDMVNCLRFAIYSQLSEDLYMTVGMVDSKYTVNAFSVVETAYRMLVVEILRLIDVMMTRLK